MCPRTSWSLSSFTRNIVLGRASVTSPSNSIFSYFGKPRPNLPACLAYNRVSAAHEARLSEPFREERLDRRGQVLGCEQWRRDVVHTRVRATHAVLEEGAHHALRRVVRARGARGEPASKLD